MTVDVPAGPGQWRTVPLREPRDWPQHPGGFSSRVAFAAAHVVADPLGGNVPGAAAAVDWDATLGVRRWLFSHGLGVAEAMDTAQRNMGLDWPAVQELVRRSAAQARELGARIVAGAGTDHLAQARTLDDVVTAYRRQVEAVEDAGSQVVVMASRHLAALARGPDDYLAVYDAVLSRVGGPVILHWLGEVFDPSLAGYWGSRDVTEATGTVLDLVRGHVRRIDGVKVSLLSAEHEVALRAALPAGVRLYTGDDFHYPELILGDGARHSDALLGAFAVVAPAAAAALAALDAGDHDAYDREMSPTVPLSRHVFEAPTSHYKVGIAFLSWLAGRQPGFTMLAGLQSARSVRHLCRAFELANAARLLPDPDLAARRMHAFLQVCGVSR
ncbi:MAG: dihydrodipicolinate synthase family protein [Actinomycetales bacterium]